VTGRKRPGKPENRPVSIFQAPLSTENIRFLVRALKARFRDQKAELATIRRHVRPGDIVCDIGANKGNFVYWLSRWCGHGRVVAFEPQPELASGLADLCRAGLGNVKVEAKAVYSHSGERDLFLPKRHQPGASLHRAALGGEGFTTLSVPLVSLDDYFGENDRVTLLKIDVEGAELEVFKGAERILRQHAPLLVFECENRHLAPGDVRDVFSYLASLGYEGSFVCRNRLLPIAEFDAAVHQRQDGQWFWKRKDYCNNFVFRKIPDANGILRVGIGRTPATKHS
jgi:FkbM family methyltransferase